MEEYLKIKNFDVGEIISLIIKDLYNTKKYNDILFIRTSTTGQWLDKILLEDKNIIRILYYTDITKGYYENIEKEKKRIKNKNRIRNKNKIINKNKNKNKKQIERIEFYKAKIHSNELEKTINSLNKKFDLICIDSFHEYKESKRDFELITLLLNDNGKIICHDCYPLNKYTSSPNFILGNWSGETYIALVELAYNNPNYYYGILNIDTGIGIISKKEFELLKNNLNRDKQKELLSLHKNNNENIYDYFIENSKEIINMIDLN